MKKSVSVSSKKKPSAKRFSWAIRLTRRKQGGAKVPQGCYGSK